MRRFAGWFFSTPDVPITIRRTISWWERRRIAFNVVVGAYGFVCLMIFFAAITTSGSLKPGEDAVEPVAIMAAPFGINLLYTLGWIVEIPARLLFHGLSPRFGPFLLKVGLGIGVILISLPPAVWGGYRLFQIVGLTE